jgi:hypothetical protein
VIPPIRIDHPNIGTGTIGHDVTRQARISDCRPIRGYLRITRNLYLEQIGVLEGIRTNGTAGTGSKRDYYQFQRSFCHCIVLAGFC